MGKRGPRGRTHPVNGERVNQLRLDRKLLKQDLAQKAGVSTVTVGYIEKGSRLVSEAVLIAIAKVLGVSWKTLVLESPEQSANSEWILQELKEIREALASLERRIRSLEKCLTSE